MKTLQERITELRTLIRTYDAAYYSRGESIISDKEYDTLYHELVRLEKENPEFISPDSPTQRVGNDLTKEFTKTSHRVPMMSIDNTYSEKELQEWIERIQRTLPEEKLSFVGELKVDGLAASLIFEDGRFTTGVTRGNGVVGDDVTQNLRTIKGIPLSIKIPCALGRPIATTDPTRAATANT
jgi:DNA ligase (NAD+)